MRYLLSIILLAILAAPAAGDDYTSSIYYFLKGYRSDTQGRHEEAINDYRTALSFNPESSDIRKELALAYLRKGEVNKAEALLTEAVELNPPIAPR
jgi:tetratricopeptide (TPR) repeat protein